MSDYRAAWVPETEFRPYDDAVDMALDWLEADMAQHGLRGAVVVTNTKGGIGAMPERLGRFAARHTHTSPRSSYRVGPPRGVAVLVYVPTEEAFLLGERLASGASVVAVESYMTPLRGWARAVGAIDLTGGPPLDALPDEVAEALDQLHFYGNNGWTRGFGADQATRVLQELHRAGRLDRDEVTSAMLARSKHADAVKRLGQLIDKVQAVRR
jgi:hypothetical protein